MFVIINIKITNTVEAAKCFIMLSNGFCYQNPENLISDEIIY